ncbi:MAG: hypothetical protein HOJ07_18605 [Rhodospirillaceae bacterium]|nr:hypothetical protein [Rhodospirillaceae bacterium]
MLIKSKTLLLVAALAALTALTAPAFAQEDGGHAGHDMSAMMSVGEDGSWSYVGRENPKMLLHGRWETVPLDGRASAAISAAGITHQARCNALMASENLIHDHATRAACTGTNPSLITEEQPQSSQHQDMDH